MEEEARGYVKAKANSMHDNSVRMRGVITFPVLISNISSSTGNHVICFLPGVDYRVRTASCRPHGHLKLKTA
ncbi:hypothetical protein G5714_014129 [Onychostoma macrolepis]|uniref:Uncharacterized protein n=1 Tax=Onychostoma macrolepis TaxID=369639 RepID=A0A7J6CBW6_9TELE|nr:hypothetical protein G5714_014129 [Onychostoma macrolepis]